MELSSQRFKALAVSAALSFWFVIISSILRAFDLEIFAIFVITTFIITQIFVVQISKALDILAIINTKIFLGILFVVVISIYGILFKALRVDLLRLKKNDSSYWLEMEKSEPKWIFKQY